MTRFYTIAETAEQLAINPRSVYRLIHAKRLRPTPVGSGTRPRMRISESELKRFERAQTSGKAA